MKICDQLLVDFMDMFYLAKGSVWVPKHAVLAVQKRIAGYTGHLERAWSSLGSWKLKTGSKNRVPMARVPMLALFITCLGQSFLDPLNAIYWISAGVMFRLAFAGLLRPIEMTNLRFSDIYFHDEAGVMSAVLRIANPKNALVMGLAQFTVVRDSCLVAWLVWLCHGAAPQLKIWPSGRSRLTTFFKQACGIMLGLNVTCPWTLACFRCGWATDLILSGFEVARLTFQGRWRSKTSLTSYVQEAMSMLVLSQLPSSSQTALKSLCTAGAPFVEVPPSIPWTALFSRKRQWRSLHSPPKPSKHC